jgi:hypothetical protein
MYYSTGMGESQEKNYEQIMNKKIATSISWSGFTNVFFGGKLVCPFLIPHRPFLLCSRGIGFTAHVSATYNLASSVNQSAGLWLRLAGFILFLPLICPRAGAQPQVSISLGFSFPHFLYLL